MAWPWITLGFILAALGAWLLITGRFLPRFRTTSPHCPSCRYELKDLPSLTCPECGLTARTRNELLAIPGRLSLRMLGLFLLLLADPASRTRDIAAHGWPATIPDWALVRVVPSGREADDLLAAFGPNRSNNLLIRSLKQTPRSQWTGLNSPTLHERLIDELSRRIEQGSMSKRNVAVFIKRVALGDSPSASIKSVWPERWPYDCSFPIPQTRSSLISIQPHTFSSPASHATVTLSINAFYLLGEGSYSVDVTLPIDATASLADFYPKRQGPAIDDAVGALLNPHLIFSKTGIDLQCDNPKGFVAISGEELGIAPIVQVLHNGEPIAWGLFWVGHNLNQPGILTPMLTWADGGSELCKRDYANITIRFVADPSRATVNLLYLRRVNKAAVWSGTVTLKPTILNLD